jgi:hypothetical protein
VTLSLTLLCYYAECRILFTIILHDIMLSVVMLNVIMLSVVMLSVVMLSVVMLSVVMLSVVAYKKLAIGKHSSLFSSIVSDEEKKYNNDIDTGSVFTALYILRNLQIHPIR